MDNNDILAELEQLRNKIARLENQLRRCSSLGPNSIVVSNWKDSDDITIHFVSSSEIASTLDSDGKVGWDDVTVDDDGNPSLPTPYTNSIVLTDPQKVQVFNFIVGLVTDEEA